MGSDRGIRKKMRQNAQYPERRGKTNVQGNIANHPDRGKED